MRNTVISAAVFAAFFGAHPALGEQTEIFLEEGHVEVQLANGGFIGLSAGADLAIDHEADGGPKLIEIFGGAVQLMSGFGTPTPFRVQAGDAILTMDGGSAVLSLDENGTVTVLVLNGDGVAMEGSDSKVGPGQAMSMTADGVVSITPISLEAMRAATSQFIESRTGAEAAAGGLSGVAPAADPSGAGPKEGVLNATRDSGRAAADAREQTGGNVGGGGNTGGGNVGGGGGNTGGGGNIGGGGGGGGNPPPVDPPEPPDPDVFPPNVVDLFNKIPPGQRNDLDNLPKKFQDLVDKLSPADRKALEQLIAQGG